MNCASQDTKAEALATLDLIHLSRQTAGDASLQRELLAMFQEHSPKLLHRMRAIALEPEPQMRPIRDLAHQLKGSALAIGAFRLADAAERVETAYSLGPFGQKTGKMAALEALGAELGAAVGAIDAHLKAPV
jgi:HPt (histidine-containing phosphotransfer) domain-containing protein